MKKLATSYSIDGIKNLISEYYFGSTISLDAVDEEHFVVRNKNGIISGVKVVVKEEQYIFQNI